MPSGFKIFVLKIFFNFKQKYIFDSRLGFNTDITEIIGLTTIKEKQLIDISCNYNLKRKLKESSLATY